MKTHHGIFQTKIVIILSFLTTSPASFFPSHSPIHFSAGGKNEQWNFAQLISKEKVWTQHSIFIQLYTHPKGEQLSPNSLYQRELCSSSSASPLLIHFSADFPVPSKRVGPHTHVLSASEAGKGFTWHFRRGCSLGGSLCMEKHMAWLLGGSPTPSFIDQMLRTWQGSAFCITETQVIFCDSGIFIMEIENLYKARQMSGEISYSFHATVRRKTKFNFVTWMSGYWYFQWVARTEILIQHHKKQWWLFSFFFLKKNHV